MDEMQWLTCNSPPQMLRYLNGGISERKLRLYACAACRRHWWLLRDERSRKAVEVAERCADGLVGAAELMVAADNAKVAAVHLAGGLGGNIAETAAMTAATAKQAAERAAFAAGDADMLRHIMGNPFRPIIIEADWLAWRDGTVAKLAATIYQEYLFSDLPILADALEEAGCTNAAILDHCRLPGEHMRGCWLLDLLLRRE